MVLIHSLTVSIGFSNGAHADWFKSFRNFVSELQLNHFCPPLHKHALNCRLTLCFYVIQGREQVSSLSLIKLSGDVQSSLKSPVSSQNWREANIPLRDLFFFSRQLEGDWVTFFKDREYICLKWERREGRMCFGLDSDLRYLKSLLVIKQCYVTDAKTLRYTNNSRGTLLWMLPQPHKTFPHFEDIVPAKYLAELLALLTCY